MNDYKYLQTKRKTYHSQHGEDGLLEYLFTKIPSNKWSVEFGAWDAKYLSNTFHFIEKHNYSAVLIEGDKDKMGDLEKNTQAYKDRVFNMNAFVDSEGENTLDNLLKKTPIPYDFDILSIDIDGQDYNVWEAFTQYKPKVVIIEINAWNKPNVIKIHTKENNEYNVKGSSGTSIKALTLLARKKGYALLTNVSCNAIFVDAQYLTLFFDKEPEPEDVYTYEVFGLNELNIAEAKRKSTKDFIQKLVRYPYHIFKYGK